MDSYVTIDVSNYGLSFDSAQFYFDLSWLGLGIAVIAFVAYNLYKSRKGKR